MTWRLAQSLIVLRDQIDAMYPNRDKRTDGALSGYPGSISGHNPNSQGVVCALDITTGDYPGGISMAQSYPLADAIRLELLAAPRGLYTYLIHHMEPPYVPTPGKYIAHGGPASLWQWIPYTGTDPHTSHIHVSVDWDIAAGEDASGQDPYDMTDPWNLSAVSVQSGTITPIQQEDDMSYTQWPQADRIALLEDIKNVFKPTQDRVLGGIPAGPARGAIPGVPRATDNGDIWDIRQDISKLPTAILGQSLKLDDGTVTTLASLLAAIFAKPSGTGSSVAAAVTAKDVENIASATATKVAATYKDQINK
jgi:hypothetical protein